jgi:RNA 2',3'-cyclic 3'-phosphodiesterase
MRLFAGIEINDAVRALAAEAIAALHTSGAPLRFERPEKMHVTLAFLGSTPPEKLDAVVAALAAGAAAQKRFALRFDRVGAFPNESRPRVIWLGCSDPGEAFTACERGVRGALAPLGYRFDSDAVAHVTLCRAKPPLRGMPHVGIEQGASLDVSSVCLFESLQEGRTTRYVIRAQASLA